MDVVSGDYWARHKGKRRLMFPMVPTFGPEEEESSPLDGLNNPVDSSQSVGFLESLKNFGSGLISMVPESVGTIGSIINRYDPTGLKLGDKFSSAAMIAGSVAAGPIGAFAAAKKIYDTQDYKGTYGEGTSAYLRDVGKNIGGDEDSISYKVGNIAATIASMATGVGEVNAAFKLGTAGKLLTGAGVGGALQGIQDYAGYEGKKEGIQKISGQEYLARIAGGTLAGLGTSALASLVPMKFATSSKLLNSVGGVVAPAAVDFGIGAGTQAGISGAQYLAADSPERQQEILSNLPKEAIQQGAINVGIGLGLRGMEALPGKIQQVKSKLAPPQQAPQQAAPKTAPSLAAQSGSPYQNIVPKISAHLTTLPPEQLAIIQERTGTKGLNPDAMAARISEDAKATDVYSTGGGMEWIDRILGVDWHQKGAPAQQAAEPAPVQEPQIQEPAQIQEPIQTPEPIQEPAQAIEPAPEQTRPVDQVPESVQEPVQHLDQEVAPEVAPPSEEPLSPGRNVQEEITADEPQQVSQTQGESNGQEEGLQAQEVANQGADEATGETPTYSEVSEEPPPIVSESENDAPLKQVDEPIKGEPYVQQRTEDNTNSEPGQREDDNQIAKAEDEKDAASKDSKEEVPALKYSRDRTIQDIMDAYNSTSDRGSINAYKAERAIKKYEDTGGIDTGNDPVLDELIRHHLNAEHHAPLAEQIRGLEDKRTLARDAKRQDKVSSVGAMRIDALLNGSNEIVPINNFKTGNPVRDVVSILEQYTGEKLPNEFIKSGERFDFTDGDSTLATLISDPTRGVVVLSLGDTVVGADKKFMLTKASELSGELNATSDLDIAEMFSNNSGLSDDFITPDGEGSISELDKEDYNREKSREKRKIERPTDKFLPGDDPDAYKQYVAKRVKKSVDTELSQNESYDSVANEVVRRAEAEGTRLTKEEIPQYLDSYKEMVKMGDSPDDIEAALAGRMTVQEAAKLSDLRDTMTDRAIVEHDIAQSIKLSENDIASSGVKMRSRKKKGGDGAIILQSTLGMLPRAATDDLEDDKYYLPGLNGHTIKVLSTALGAFMFFNAGRKMMGLGAKVNAGRRATVFEYIRRPFVDGTGIKTRINELGTANGWSKAYTQKEFVRAVKDNEILNSFPFFTSGTNVHTISRLVDHQYTRDLAKSIAKGENAGDMVAIPAHKYKEALEKINPELAGRYSELNRLEDWEKTEIVNKHYQGPGSPSGMNNPNLIAELNKWDADTAARLKQNDPELYDVYEKMRPLKEMKIKADVEARAFEHTGHQIDNGIQHFHDLSVELHQLSNKNLVEYTRLKNDPYVSDVEKADALYALQQVDFATKQALSARNSLFFFRDFRDLSVKRGYMPRFFDTLNSPYNVRIKQTLADPGSIITFKNKEDMNRFVEKMEAQTSSSHFNYAKHPITGEDITSQAELFRSQGGGVHIMSKGDAKIGTQEVNAGAIRSLVEELVNASGPNGSIPSDRAARFFKSFGSDIANVVDAQSLAEIGITSDSVNKGLTSVAQLRALINKISMPKYIDSFAHRTNVDGYAPHVADPNTGYANKNYNKEILEWELAGLEHTIGGIRKRIASASLQAEVNKQAADLVARGIAPRYVRFLAQLNEGIRWRDTSDLDHPTLSKIDKQIVAPAIVLKMMGFNVPSNVKNFQLGYVNTAAEASLVSGGVVKGLARTAKADAQYVSHLKDMMGGDNLEKYLTNPSSLTTIAEDVKGALIRGGDPLKKVMAIARAGKMLDAQAVRSIERTLPDAVKNNKVLRWGEKAALGGYELVEDHNRGAAFILGASAHLSDHPNDIDGALVAGRMFMNNAQGNFSSYARTKIERSLLSMPFGRTVMTMSTSAIRSSEQLGVHIMLAASKPHLVKVWAPVLGAIMTLGATTGLEGSPFYGDTYKLLTFFAKSITGDEKDLASVKENVPEAIRRHIGNIAESAGLPRELIQNIHDSYVKGLASHITGRNLSASNNISDMIIDPIALSQAKSISEFASKFPSGDAHEKLRQFLKLTTVSGYRAERAIENYAAGGQLDKSGKFVIGEKYTGKDALLDFLVGSKLKDSEAGEAMREGGGTAYSQRDAQKYVQSLDAVDGIKLGNKHIGYFMLLSPTNKDEKVFSSKKVNDFRDKLLNNYNALKPQEEQAVSQFKKVLNDPKNASKLVDWALHGQEATRNNNEVESKSEQALKKVKSYFVATAIDKTFREIGLPPIQYKYRSGRERQFGAALDFMTGQSRSRTKENSRNRMMVPSGVEQDDDE